MRPTFSVVIPAYNEADNIEVTVNEVLTALGDRFANYEILIFDDHSMDRTGSIADALAEGNSNIEVIHNERNMGFGYNYIKGVELARNDYIALVPGDNSFPADSLEEIFSEVGRADIVLPYPLNFYVRPLLRRVVSMAFTKTMNLLFDLSIEYYNGPVIHKSEIVKAVKKTTSGYAYQAEILIRLIKSGYSFVEVGIDIQERKRGASKAFRLKNIVSVIKTVLKLFYEINLKGERV